MESPAVKKPKSEILAMAGRIAAIPASYLLGQLASSCIARLLPIAPVNAAVTGMLISFAIIAALVIWAFSARSVLRLWLWFAGSAVVLGGGLALSIMLGGRV